MAAEPTRRLNGKCVASRRNAPSVSFSAKLEPISRRIDLVRHQKERAPAEAAEAEFKQRRDHPERGARAPKIIHGLNGGFNPIQLERIERVRLAGLSARAQNDPASASLDGAARAAAECSHGL
jgi:hypothetical protein